MQIETKKRGCNASRGGSNAKINGLRGLNGEPAQACDNIFSGLQCFVHFGLGLQRVA